MTHPNGITIGYLEPLGWLAIWIAVIIVIVRSASTGNKNK